MHGAHPAQKTLLLSSALNRTFLDMGLVQKLIGSANRDQELTVTTNSDHHATIDGAIDTLGCIVRAMGKDSFPLESDLDPTVFPTQCDEFACHVENGAAVPSVGIEQTPNGSREWALVRRFFVDRRQNEKNFVTERLQGYRGVVEDLVSGLRQIGQRDQNTEQSVRNSLDSIESAVDKGMLPEIKATLDQTIKNVTEIFSKQKREYESQIDELNERMQNLRQDLVDVQEEMKRDTLTDVFNRGAFDTAIAQSINLKFILNQPVTIVLIDIDNFKQVNDQFGHSAGDQVLRSIGECLERAFIRKSDLVARFGGDEFAVILNDTTAERSGPLINRFIDSVGAVSIPDAGEDERVSCSAGYAEICASDSVETLLKRADNALYEAKAAGRNRAIFAPSTETDSQIDSES